MLGILPISGDFISCTSLMKDMITLFISLKTETRGFNKF